MVFTAYTKTEERAKQRDSNLMFYNYPPTSSSSLKDDSMRNNNNNPLISSNIVHKEATN